MAGRLDEFERLMKAANRTLYFYNSKTQSPEMKEEGF